MRHVRFLLLILIGAVFVSLAGGQTRAQSTNGHTWLNPFRDDASRLIKAATADDFAWRRLAELTDTFGARLSGSENDEGRRPRERPGRSRDGAEVGARD
jgi:hypothetical protein